jgi:hypothetical protein
MNGKPSIVFWVSAILSGEWFARRPNQNMTPYKKSAIKLFGLALVCLWYFPHHSLTASPQWLAVRDKDLRIKAGSALDLSQLFDKTSADLIQEPLVISADGHLYKKNNPSTAPLRFLCASLTFSPPHGGFPEHGQADELATQLRLKGYNLARFHFVDAMLMTERDKDFDYDPVQVDRFHYLLYALKRNGIRWAIDAATSPNGAYGNIKPHRWINQKELKLRVYFDPEAQDHWKTMVNTILNVKNPYTDTIILQDSALTYVTLFNETGIGFITRDGYPLAFQNKYQEWITAKYPNYKAHATPGRYDHSPEAAFMQKFIGELELNTAVWMTEYLKNLGYNGLVTTFNNGRNLQAIASRINLDIITGHSYHDHPSDFTREGSRQKADSSLDDTLSYYRRLAVTRFIGKPFGAEEYDHPYWNPYRREAGLALPALASFQNWDLICRYTNPVELRYDPDGPERARAIYPFGIGMDPVASAGETLSIFLFRRGDVQPSQNQMTIELARNDTFSEYAGIREIPDPFSLLSLVTGIGIQWTDSSLHSPLNFNLASHGGTILQKLYGGTTTTWQNIYEKLNSANILAADNRTSPTGDFFESDTGQIFINPPIRRMTVITPKTEAVVFENFTPLRLNSMSIENADVPAMVAISSLDNKEIAKSSRLLLIIATDAINSGSKFQNGRIQLMELGTLPVLLQATDITMNIRHEYPEGFSLYALSMTGERRERLELQRNNDNLSLRINLSDLKNGPTTYFELVKENSVQD